MVYFLLGYSTSSNFMVHSFNRLGLIPMTKNKCIFGCFSKSNSAVVLLNRHSFRMVTVTCKLFLLVRSDITVGRYKRSFVVKLREYR